MRMSLLCTAFVIVATSAGIGQEVAVDISAPAEEAAVELGTRIGVRGKLSDTASETKLGELVVRARLLALSDEKQRIVVVQEEIAKQSPAPKRQKSFWASLRTRIDGERIPETGLHLVRVEAFKLTREEAEVGSAAVFVRLRAEQEEHKGRERGRDTGNGGAEKVSIVRPCDGEGYGEEASVALLGRATEEVETVLVTAYHNRRRNAVADQFVKEVSKHGTWAGVLGRDREWRSGATVVIVVEGFGGRPEKKVGEDVVRIEVSGDR